LADPNADGHATLICADGQCKVGACLGNWADANARYEDGCETSCAITGPEYCDNLDNDCDGKVDADDPDLVLPDTLCSGRTEGVCAGHQTQVQALGPQCVNGKLSCNPARAGIAAAEADETLCDGQDNDCDGKVDEMYPAIGQRCFKGTGGCRTEGVYVCAPGGYSCSASQPAAGKVESCNGADDDCNGVVDDFVKPGPSAQVPGVATVDVGNNVLMITYEASRPDATASAPGSMTHAACSASDKTPWANVTWGEANAACCALNASGQCAGDQKGWRLCDASTWEATCKGRDGSCTWGYSNTATVPCSRASATSAYEMICRGVEDTRPCPGGGGACPAGDYTDCYSALSGGNVFDMSGNVREWTYTQTNTQEQANARANGLSVPAPVYAIRGGGYSNSETARTCAFDFGAGDDAFHFPTTGFRCCYYP
jgi:formylglycine-generating enzyme required for sulfatase activity